MARVGRKISDKRWKDSNGEVWASKFEADLYSYLQDCGSDVRRCAESDSFDYTEPKARARCLACGSGECVQDRVYTPDLYIVPKSGATEGYYIEAKGYFRAEKRTLFRHFCKCHQNLDLRVVLEANHWVTRGKTRLKDYIERYCKLPVVVGIQNIPEDWL